MLLHRRVQPRRARFRSRLKSVDDDDGENDDDEKVVMNDNDAQNPKHILYLNQGGNAIGVGGKPPRV